MQSEKSDGMQINRRVIDVGEGRGFAALGAHVERLVHPLTTASDALGVSLCVMRPGDRIRRHHHSYEEAYFVLSGTGLMYLQGEPDYVELHPNRCVYVPPNHVHGQINTGTEDLQILCSLSPPPIEGQAPLFDDDPEEGP